jgi:hypothetical protein
MSYSPSSTNSSICLQDLCSGGVGCAGAGTGIGKAFSVSIGKHFCVLLL